MPQTIKYIGTTSRWPELAFTGQQSVWNPGQLEERSDAEVAKLLATGLFEIANLPVATVKTHPITGGNDLLVGTSTVKLPAGELDLTGGVGGGGGGGGSGSGLVTGRTITVGSAAVLTDEGTIVQANSASAIAVTIPNDSTVAWEADSVIAVYQVGAGVASFAAGSGVTLRVPSSYSASVQYDTIFARRVGASEWVVSK